MGDSLHISSSKWNKAASGITSKVTSKQHVVATRTKTFSWKTLNHLLYTKNLGLGGGSAEQIVVFLAKVAALEMVRRLSQRKCPFIWKSLQALQILLYPPFKCVQKWAPFNFLVKCMQRLSRPLLLLSVATAFSDPSDQSKKPTDRENKSQPSAEASASQSTPDIRILEGPSENVASENWLSELLKELENQGISIPERITEDDLHRFYMAANGEFPCLVSSVKRTIQWRESYNILSTQELEVWSHLVFWHGRDVEFRPCLIVRLGLACSSLAAHERPRFAQAVVSQIEHGVLYLVNVQDPRITVLLDCEGVSAIRFPLQMMRSFCSLVQCHYPNRLCLLFVLKLPPVVRVIAQTLFQVLKPTTRQKLRVLGEVDHKILVEHLQTIPAFLGGECTCPKCMALAVAPRQRQIEEIAVNNSYLSDAGSVEEDPSPNNLMVDGHFDRVLRTVVVGILMFWILIALIAGMYDPDTFALFGSDT
ncbi:phosphatidylinositol/phosphatidylcholine transfer protein SFH8 [Aristolochia californica]|uniref:phosphatidylinositol/phosphatidylcholine transfer protein SFH8 n=1 Tax=Aristolochia californica TaxID=171875 RepID=UPI0035E0A518